MRTCPNAIDYHVNSAGVRCARLEKKLRTNGNAGQAEPGSDGIGVARMLIRTWER